jgi:dihydroxyacid dehydratase/phosphogluconate dehydratase
MMPEGSPLRSAAWLSGEDEVALNHRAALRAAGLTRATGPAAARLGARPLIGIASTASDLNRCDRGLTSLAEAVRRGVLAAGGLPLEFPVMSLSEDLMKPTAMLYRNLLAIEVEETLRSHPLDGLVALGNCDKSVPAYLMALASADLPALIVTGGFRPVPVLDGVRLGSGTALWQQFDERRAGRLSDADWVRLEGCLGAGIGACNTMGTAVTMAIMAEVLGLTLPGSAVVQSGDPAQEVLAEQAGQRIVSLVRTGTRPSSLLTPSGFERAMTVLAAVGGSTNAIIHLCAVAGRRGLSLPLAQFAAIAAQTPVIADIAPTGTGLMPDLAAAGGVPAVLDVLFSAAAPRGSLRSPADPVTDAPAFTVVRGNIAPDGGVIKTAAASPSLLRHSGPAVVFHSYDEMRRRVDDPDLDVTADSVLVMAGCGPVGAFMPEWGNIPIPRKLLRDGVTDMVRITDGRMSGTGYGTVVLHVAPESAIGGPLSRLRDGDVITLDAPAGILSAEVPAEVLAARDPVLPVFADRRGWPALHRAHVLQAPDGCDYDFLTVTSAEQLPFVEPVIGRS